MEILKNTRFIVLAVLVLVSIYFLISPMFFKGKGVFVDSVTKDNNCGGIREGDSITEVGGSIIKTSEDFKNAVQNLKAGEHVNLVVNGGPGGCIAINNGDLGINVSEAKTEGLKFGVDIGGGSLTTLKPEVTLSSNELDSIKNIIEKRAKVLNVPYIKVSASDGLIKLFSSRNENLAPLEIKGDFEAKILEDVIFINNTGEIPVGNNSYAVNLNGTKINVNGSFYSVNQSFSLEDINFEITNITNSSASLKAFFFSSEDISKVLNSYGYVQYDSNSGSYEFNVPVQLLPEASQRFTKITRRMSTKLVSNQPILDGSLEYSLDGEDIDVLPIPFSMVGSNLNTIAILGFKKTSDLATNYRMLIDAPLETAKLPTNLNVVNSEAVNPIYDKTILYTLIIVIAILIFLPIVLFYVMYKKILYGIYATALLGAMSIMIFGAVAFTQLLFTHGWYIDLPTFSGLVSILCITIVSMFLISEQKLKKREFSLHYGYKKIMNSNNLLILLVAIISFVILFTSWRGFGLSMAIGLIVDLLLINSSYIEVLKIT